MICPDCLEEYTFIKFEVDPETLEHRGQFTCDCMEAIVFPEFITREIISDDDLKDQLRHSRLHYLACSVAENEIRTVSVSRGVINLETRHLQRYLQTFSEQSLRQLK